MREIPRPNRISSEAPVRRLEEAPQINTPVIDAAARLPGKGAKLTPRLDDEDQRDFAKEDEDALVALEQIEKALRGQLPG